MKKMYSRDYILMLIKNHILENYTYDRLPNMFRYKKNHEVEWFYQLSYQEWAANEILELLMEEDEDHLIINDLDDIRHMFDTFACRAKCDEARFMFSVAEDVASDLMDFVIGME